jgi:DNA repair exonuclease SbcCD ATPase subunit
MSLKDFNPENPDFEPRVNVNKDTGSDIKGTEYHEEINTLKIDKLSNRVTIISVILPCIIGAILIFGYLDMKERVVDADQTKQSQVENLSSELKEKLNALDVKIAKNNFEIENSLPELKKKALALEGEIAKLTSSKADTKVVKEQLSKFESRVAGNTNQNKSINKAVEKINKGTLAAVKINKEALVAIKSNKEKLNKISGQTKKELSLFTEEFDARLLKLSDYDQQIGELRMNGSLLDKKYKALEQDIVLKSALEKNLSQLKSKLNRQIEELEVQIDIVEQKMNANIPQLQKEIELLLKSSSSKNPAGSASTVPSNSVEIEEKPLTE